jgi:DNA-binding transcriptional ArsR family regulator
MDTEIMEKLLEMPPAGSLELPRVLHALSDPVRLEIVHTLAAGEQACGAFPLPVSDATRSHHLKVLREAGLTRTRVVGTTRYVSLRHDDLAARFPGLLDSVLAAA